MRRLTADERADVRVAKATKTWFASARRTVTAAGIWRNLSGHNADDVIDRYHPARRFGRATLIALTATDPGCCRWGALFRASADEHIDMPALTPARLELLGEPCPACSAAMAAALDSGVHASLSPQMRARVARRVVRASLVASVRAAQPFLHDPFTQPCAICFDYRTRARVALTAGAEIETLRPHKPRPASTGYAGIITGASRSSTRVPRFMHELVGGEQRCNCPTCKSSRSRAARKLMSRSRAE
jgi:hypothetical protein